MDIYNAIRHKGDIDTRLAPELDGSVALWLEKLCTDGWSMLKEATPGEENHGASHSQHIHLGRKMYFVSII